MEAHGFLSGPWRRCHCAAECLRIGLAHLPASSIGQDDSHHNTHTHTHTHRGACTRAQWKPHGILSYLPFSGFPSPMLVRGQGCAGGIWGLSSSWSALSSSASFEADFPLAYHPLLQCQLTGYPGNPAGRLPVTMATQHGCQAVLLRKVRGPARQQSCCEVASRTGPGGGRGGLCA